MDVAGYRAKARELREKASAMHSESGRNHMLAMADHYDWLAEQAEKREGEAQKEKPRR
jgi:hypothetical protein